MIYKGSRIKEKKEIVPYLNFYIKDNNITKFYDLFCGGANITSAIDCENVYASDLSPTLISLHMAAQKNFDLIPSTINEEEWNKALKEFKKIIQYTSDYRDLRDYQQLTSLPLYVIGAAEWYANCSQSQFHFPNFDSINGTRYYEEAYNVHKLQASHANYKNIHFSLSNYWRVLIEPNSLIYCDAPHKNGVSYLINHRFDYNKYYNWLRYTSKFHPIFITEREMPSDFKIVWSSEKTKENLYFIDNRA